MITLYDGEKQFVGVTVSRTDGGEFTISGATCVVKDVDGNIVIASSEATIDTADVYRLIDTTASGMEAGERYQAYFSISIDGSTEVLVAKVEIDVIQ